MVADFTEDEHVDLQRRVHRLPTAICSVGPTDHLYLLSLGSRQGNSHVPWHLAPLPPEVPSEEQQYKALVHEHGYLDIPDADQRVLAEDIRSALALLHR